MSRFRFIQVETARGVQTITLNRPEKRNALSPELIDELTLVLDETSVCDCGVVILTGAGSAFCAGLDMEHLETMNARTVEQHRRDSENMARVLRTLYEFPKPGIAAVNGPAIAGGMGLVTRIVQPEDLLAEAHALAQSLLLNSPQAMRAVKELLAAHSANQLDEEIEGAIGANALQRSTEDFREGVRAFLEHRRPEWPSVNVHAKEHEHVKV